MEKMLRMIASGGDAKKAGIKESASSNSEGAKEMASWLRVMTEGVNTADDFQDEVEVDNEEEKDADNVESPMPEADDYNDSGLYGLDDVVKMAGEEDADEIEIEVNGKKVSDEDTGADIEKLDPVGGIENVDEDDDSEDDKEPEEEKEDIRTDDDLEDQEREEELEKVEDVGVAQIVVVKHVKRHIQWTKMLLMVLIVLSQIMIVIKMMACILLLI